MPRMPRMPRDKSPDSTMALMIDPYGFISKRCRLYGSDVFQTRIQLQTTLCMTGPEAARLFYDPNRFMRRGAAPLRVQNTLFGKGGIQTLDDGAHRNRKQMFLSLMTPERIGQLAETTADWWSVYARRWASKRRVVLYDEMQEILTRAVCEWAGVPLAEKEVRKRTRELTALFDGAGSAGPKHWLSRTERKRADAWITTIVEQIRAGRLEPPEDSAAHVIAWHRELNGELLKPRVAAVEILNILRPTVAVAVYITFAAHALHEHPEVREEARDGDEGFTERFVQEVRRFYPFFPATVALVREDFEWKGYHFPKGTRTMLDLYGTNHDPRSWEDPEEFRPERFRHWNGSPFNFIPQGGGDHLANHRCPGEWITIELMKVALDFLARRLAYDVPKQDLRIAASRLPALPRSRFILSNVRMDDAFGRAETARGETKAGRRKARSKAVVGLAGIAGGALILGSFAWKRSTARAVGRLGDRGDGAGGAASARETFSRDQLAGLPDLVVRYFEFALTPGMPLVWSARIEHEGEFRKGFGARWSPFTSVQHFSMDPPGFVWDAGIRMSPLLTMRVRDSYLWGTGAMQARLASLVPVVDAQGGSGLASGSLHRYLAESVWFPTALLPGRGVAWEAVDDSTARATLTDSGISVSLDFLFGARGEIVSAYTPARFRDVGGTAVPTPWMCHFESYEPMDGMMVPMKGEVEWLLPEGRLSYWRGRIVKAEYERALENPGSEHLSG